MKRPPHRRQGRRTEQQQKKNATTGRQQRAFVWVFTTIKTMLNPSLYTGKEDGITEVCRNKANRLQQAVCGADNADL